MKRTEKKRKLTEEEIDALVVAEADDPSAWGDPIIVPPSKSQRPAWMAQAKHLDLRRSMLARECRKLDKGEEQALAEEGYLTEREPPEY